MELEAAEDDLDSIQQEIKMLQAFNCPQLTRYHGSFIVGRFVRARNFIFAVVWIFFFLAQLPADSCLLCLC